MKIWFLEGYLGARGMLQRVRLSHFPFRIGRQDGLSLVLDHNGISRLHAEIDAEGDRLFLTDLNSTNGTYVNRQLISGRQPIREGDIVHLADREFRLISEAKTTGYDLELTRQDIVDLPANLPQGSREFQQLLVEGRVSAVYQPIVDRRSHTVAAYEMLGRGCHEGLSEAPLELFRIAESLEMEVHLSELFRRTGIGLAQRADPAGCYFTNIHPHEMRDPDRLLSSMEEVRESYPDLALVLEIHEAAVANRQVLQQVRDRMNQANIGIAYDDFGTGQARLVELAEVPPDYVKLDISLMRDVDSAPAAKQQMVRMLVSYAREMNIQVIAEGINTDAEAKFCDDLKIDLLQGFRYGHPEPLA